MNADTGERRLRKDAREARVREWLCRNASWHRAELGGFDGGVTFAGLERRLRGGESFYAITRSSNREIIGTCVLALARLYGRHPDFYADLANENGCGRSGADALVGRMGKIAKAHGCRLHFDADFGIIHSIPKKEDKTMNKNIIRKTPEFKALRAEAREVIAAYADGADFDYVISRLAPIGEKMSVLLA